MVEYQITNLSNNNFQNEDPQISGDKVVWEGNDQIFFYDGNQTVTITNNNFDNQDPQISGNNIVWEGYTADGFFGGKVEVFLFDGQTTINSESPTGTFNNDPQISGDNVVWAVNNEILLYNIQSEATTSLADTTFENKNPQISGNNVVWVGEDDSDKEIILYDGTRTLPITNNNFDDNNPQISGNNVVWEGDEQIFFYSIQTKEVKQVTNNNLDNEDPQISGQYIVWEAFDGNDEEIFFYDIETDRTIQLTDNDTNDEDPQISGKNIVWEGFDGNDEEIFFYDVETEELTQVTDNSIDDEDPQISGKNIVWEANDQIFLATPVNIPTTVPVVNLSINPTSGSESDRTTFTITATANEAVSGTQRVNIALTGSASGNDFEGNIPSTITIENGATTGTINLVVTDDNLEEGAETATFTISNPTAGITLGNTTSASATIEASDEPALPVVNLSINPIIGTESDPTTFTITATADRAVNGTQTVNVALSGTASSDDFNGNIPSTITIADGETTGTINLVVTDDNLEEGGETATFTISNPSAGITLGDKTSVSASIESSDQPTSTPVVNLSINPATGSESDTTTFTITATADSAVNGDQTVNVALTGSASGNDFDGNIPSTITITDGNTTGTIELIVTDDNLEEDAETATFTISNPSVGLTLGTTTQVSATIEASDRDTGTVEYNITNLSNNNLQNEDPQVSGDKVVWEGNKQIFFYDGNQTNTITNNDLENQDPQISGNNIVWEAFSFEGFSGKVDVFLFDGETTINTESPSGTFNNDPQISGDNVVWAVNNEILLYNIPREATTSLADTTFENKNPQISGNNVVWVGEDDSDKEIILYDGTRTLPITNNNFDDNNPQISGENIVWEGNEQIFFYNIQTKEVKQVTNNNLDNEDPQISGQYIVWEAFDGNDEDIFLYNIETESTIQLTDNDTNDEDPQISGGNIVWEGFDGSDEEIFLYNIDTEEISRITNNNFDDEDPQISGRNIVWEANEQIFLATPKTTATAIPVVNLSINPSSGSESDRTTFTITATANEPVSGTQTVNLALTGSAGGNDFDGSIPTTITIENGATTGTINLVVTDDNLEEGAKTATFTISNPSPGITLGNTTSVSATIEASDRSGATPTVNLSISPNSGSESDTSTFTITATAAQAVSGTQTLELALSGTASEDDFDGNIPTTITIADGDTTGTIEVVLNDDTLVEEEEIATFTISNPSTGITLGDTTSVSATIEASDTTTLPVVNLSIIPTNGSELDTTTFIITATANQAVNGNQTVELALSGTASSDDFDGNIPTTITITDGATTETIEVVVTDDELEEEAETATFTISNPSNGIALGNNISVSVNIGASDQIERRDRNLGDDGVTEDFSAETNALNITAGSGDDNITSGGGDDIINAGGGNNTVDAGAGNDVIVGSGESGTDNQIDGGEGTDRVTYTGARADFSVARFANGTVRVGRNTDIINNVEELQFTDQTVSVADLPIISLDESLIRFRNSEIPTGTYLFAGSEEATGIRQNFSPPFSEEGEAFKVSLEEIEGLVKFNRFRNNNISGTYIFASEEESVSIRENFPDAFTEEGTAFYAYGANYGVGQDVIRFRNLSNNTYIFALGAEAQNIRDNFSETFAEEGVAFEV